VLFRNVAALVFQIFSRRTLPVFKTGALNHSATLPATVSQALGTDTDKNKLGIGLNISHFEISRVGRFGCHALSNETSARPGSRISQ
jgi:hypothetical protein